MFLNRQKGHRNFGMFPIDFLTQKFCQACTNIANNNNNNNNKSSTFFSWAFALNTN